jgi:hypothetical protein
MAEPLPHLISILQQQGVFEIYLPFLLTFAIFYGLLRKMKIFGGDPTANKIIALISGIAAAYVMIFSPVAGPISQFFATFFTQASIGMVVLLVFIMLVGLFLSAPFIGPKEIDLGKLAPWAVFAGFVIVLYMFVSSGGVALFDKIVPPGINISGEDIAMILLVVGTVVVIGFLIGGGREEGSTGHGWRLAPY